MAVITLLTDFGQTDGYVAEMKAVILSAQPSVQLVDISHEIPPGNLFAAQYLLARGWRHFPKGTTHLVVVDPGVGTSRRAMAAELDGHRFVGPDNGVLTPVLAGANLVELAVPPGASPTFQGRDVFAPAAAKLAGGAPLRDLGKPFTDPIRLALPEACRRESDATGTVIYVDRFGTLITNIPGAWVRPGSTVRIGDDVSAPLMRTFGDVDSGEVVAFVGSGGTIEVAVRDGSAALKLCVAVGDVVVLLGAGRREGGTAGR